MLMVAKGTNKKFPLCRLVHKYGRFQEIYVGNSSYDVTAILMHTSNRKLDRHRLTTSCQSSSVRTMNNMQLAMYMVCG